MPYSGSPQTGWPIACRCTRIWCVRPVSRRSRSSEVSRERALEREVRARLAGAGAVDGHARAHARVAADRGLDRARARRRAALDEGQVLALERRAASARCSSRCDLLRARDDEQARGVAVEAVHDPGALGLAAGEPRREQLGERLLAVPAGGVHDEARPLVDDEQVLVLVGDRERRSAASRVAQRGARRELSITGTGSGCRA